jgi:hypothetical protein
MTQKFTSMTLITLCLALCLALPALSDSTKPESSPTEPGLAGPDLQIRQATVNYLENLDLLVFELQVQGKAGQTVPTARGQLDGAPVLGYVFPTTLAAADVGFSPIEGVVALAVTAHPDFDDTPLWDENSNRDYDDDGVVFHTHWVVLGPDDRVAGGLAVRAYKKEDSSVTLPPTNPGMPMYMDSPGFSVLLRGDTLKVLVPAQRVSGTTDFQFDAVTAYMEVSTSGDLPMLGVYHVYSLLSGDLSLPYRVGGQ